MIVPPATDYRRVRGAPILCRHDRPELAVFDLPGTPRGLHRRGEAPGGDLLPLLHSPRRPVPRLRGLSAPDPHPRRPAGMGMVGRGRVLAGGVPGRVVSPRADRPAAAAPTRAAAAERGGPAAS